MKKTLLTHSKSAVRELVYVARLARMLKKLTEGTDREPAIPSTFGAIDNGYFTTVGGEGPMFDKFMASRHFGDYSGRGIKARVPTDPDYNRSRMRYLPFDHCFQNDKKTVDKRNYI